MRLDPKLVSALAALSLAGCATDTIPCSTRRQGTQGRGECQLSAAPDGPGADRTQSHGPHGTAYSFEEEEPVGGGFFHGGECPTCGMG